MARVASWDDTKCIICECRDKSICRVGKFLWVIIICESKNITALFASDKGIGYKSESIVLYNYLYVRVSN